MALTLGPIGQIGVAVADVDRAESFYGDKLGLRKLFRFGTLSFFDCAGVRLLLDQVTDAAQLAGGSPLYFRVADIALARRELETRGVVFKDKIHLVAPMADHDLWMTFFDDPDGHVLALMMEAPKGFVPA
jgi:catechol 2,3-dioxygenase-like lactoylglutathione lyase family enzyme